MAMVALHLYIGFLIQLANLPRAGNYQLLIFQHPHFRVCVIAVGTLQAAHLLMLISPGLRQKKPSVRSLSAGEHQTVQKPCCNCIKLGVPLQREG